jgi:hypothetical protein
MGCLEQLTSDLGIDAWYGSVETCPQEKPVAATCGAIRAARTVLRSIERLS